MRADALRIEDDALGYPWLRWRDRQLLPVDVQYPGQTSELGDRRERIRAGLPAESSYDEQLPRDYWDASARAAQLDRMGVDEAMVFPNFGLLWERTLDADLAALTANMTAWNRWCASVATDGAGRVHPVAHVTLRDADWLTGELARLARDGVRLAMVAPALVDGRPLSHPTHDRDLACVRRQRRDAGVPRRRPTPARSTTRGTRSPTTSACRRSSPCSSGRRPRSACTDLILNGTLDRFPDLRIGIVELSAVWVPMYLMMLDGGFEFTAKLNGRPLVELAHRPSEYFRRQVRVSSFSYELPARLIRQTGDLYMCCSDYPHSEGTSTPLEDYTRQRGPAPPGGRARAVPRQRVVVAREPLTQQLGRKRALEPQQGLDALRDAPSRGRPHEVVVVAAADVEEVGRTFTRARTHRVHHHRAHGRPIAVERDVGVRP